MDDEEGKIRRNLVVASSVVILLSWLDVSPVLVAERIFGTRDSLSPESWKVWLAVAVMLVYLLLRFIFSEEGNIGYKTLLDAADENYKELMSEYFTKLGRDAELGKLPLGLLRNQVEETIRNVLLHHHEISARPKVTFTPIEAFTRGYDNRLHATFSWKSTEKLSGPTVHEEIDYEIPEKDEVLLRKRAMSRARFLSQGAMALRLPLVLGYTALMICFLKLVVPLFLFFYGLFWA